jgi:hypothetical protein
MQRGGQRAAASNQQMRPSRQERTSNRATVSQGRFLYLEGTAITEMRPERNGTVGAGRVVSSTIEPHAYPWHSVRRFDSDLFEQEVLANLRQWRFEPVARACIQRMAITFEHTNAD